MPYRFGLEIELLDDQMDDEEAEELLAYFIEELCSRRLIPADPDEQLSCKSATIQSLTIH